MMIASAARMVLVVARPAHRRLAGPLLEAIADVLASALDEIATLQAQVRRAHLEAISQK
jgi:hypothetical protein